MKINNENQVNGFFAGVGGFHLSLAKTPRRVPKDERHKWNFTPDRGQTAKCVKCGCLKIHQMNYTTIYRESATSRQLNYRPACKPKEGGQSV